jgi:hypothetical protein
MSQADENRNDSFLAVPGAGQRVVGGKAGKHAEHVRSGAELVLGEGFPSRCYHPFQNLSGNVTAAGVTDADAFRDLGIKDSLSTSPESIRLAHRLGAWWFALGISGPQRSPRPVKVSS